MSDLVVDASAPLTWAFPDEHSEDAARLLSVLRIPGNQAIVPAFFHQEILNALLVAERRGRITSVATQEFLTDFLTMAFSPETPDVRRLPAIERLSRKYRLTAYDASYLEIAIRLKLPIASFDAALVRASQAEEVVLF
jgi:predicted nucleic acid-binding protein